jgi:hypothetical protein
MDDKRYNGWTNYETWAVNLWLDNEQGSQEYLQEQAQAAWDSASLYCAQVTDGIWTVEQAATFTLADSLKDWHEEMASDITGIAGVFADLIGAALGAVNWQEIAEHLIAEVDRNTDEQEAA